MSALIRAAEALEAGDPQTGLRALIDAWRDACDSTLVEPISEAGRAARPASNPMLTSPAPTLEAAWDALAAARDPVTVPILLETISTEAQLEALARFPPDPRLGAYAIWLIEKARFPEIAARILTRSRHPRAARVLGWNMPQVVQRHDPHQVLRVVVTTDRLARERAEAERRVAPMFDAVRAEPNGDLPRQILADALIEVGDPRGELIAMQLRPHPGRHTGVLEAALCGAMASEIAPLEPLACERGFPVFAAATGGTVEPSPSFRTLRRIRVDHPDSAFLAQPDFVNVREASGPIEHLTAALAHPLPWERISVPRLIPEIAQALGAAIRAGRLPGLRFFEAKAMGDRAIEAFVGMPVPIAIETSFESTGWLADALRPAIALGWSLKARTRGIRASLQGGELTLAVEWSRLQDDHSPLIELLTGPDRKRLSQLKLTHADGVDPRWERVI